MIAGRRGQFVLLAAVVVVAALIPMLLAYAQLGSPAAPPERGVERRTLADAKRVLERSVAETTTTLANGTEDGVDRQTAVARAVVERLRPAVEHVESTGSGSGVTVAVTRNVTAANQWVGTDCPHGPARAFGACVVTDGVVTQPRANGTAVVAVAFDVTVRGGDGTAETTVVVRGVRGAVADRQRRR